jgi:hypothetical protein
MSTERTVKEQAVNLVHTISEMGNTFLDDTPELLMLDTRDVIDESVVNTVRTVEALGKDQYNTYRKSVIYDRKCTIHDSIKKNSHNSHVTQRGGHMRLLPA